MKKDIIIFGDNQFAVMMRDYIEKFTDKHVSCFTLNKEYITKSELLDLPVIPFEEIADKYPSSKNEFLVAIGYKEMNSLREKIFEQLKELNYNIVSFIHPSATIYAEKMGVGNIFLDNVYIGFYSKIGDGNIFWNGVNISHGAEIGSFNYFSPGVTLAGNVKINNNCFLGTNCTIKNGLSIANKTLVGAGCYMNDNSLENEVYVPSKAIKLAKTSNEMKL